MPWREWARIESIYVGAGRPTDFSTKREALLILYANPPNLTGVSGWRPSYDEAFLLHLLILALAVYAA
jgi:hypothetical protein